MNVKNCNRGITFCLMLSTLGKNIAADDILKYLIFLRKQDLTSCKLSPLETTCMKCQILFFLWIVFEKLENNEFVVCGNCNESGEG